MNSTDLPYHITASAVPICLERVVRYYLLYSNTGGALTLVKYLSENYLCVLKINERSVV